jgi:hypothetical protein
MNLILISDTFYPSTKSGAVQLYDLALEFVKRGDSLTVLVPDPMLESPWRIDKVNGFTILRLKTFDIMSANYFRRALAELLMPVCMMINLLRSPILLSGWSGIIWYSPSIFFGPLIHLLKIKNKCKSYLIIRDIFPEWVADLGLIKKKVFYKILKMISAYQYRMADTIGIQSEGNRVYFDNLSRSRLDIKIEILNNWLSKRDSTYSSINLSQDLGERSCIFVYIGNVGLAQDAEVFVNLAKVLSFDKNFGFVFVGRGSELAKLKSKASANKLQNIFFYDEISPNEIPALLKQCHVGLISLSPLHKSHNIPGKFLSYLLAGMPVLIRVNSGNDFEYLIRSYELGVVLDDDSPESLELAGINIASKIKVDKNLKHRCDYLANEIFSTAVAVNKIKSSLI